MKRLLALLVVILPALACNLGSAASTPTPAPPTPGISTPVVGISPVAGPPGTVISVAAAGYPPGSRVNLFLSPQNLPSTTPLTTLTVGAAGTLGFAMAIPDQLNGTPITANETLIFNLSPESGGVGASALFLALNGGTPGQITATPAGSTAGTGGATGGSTQTLFITGPGMGTSLSGSTVTVTGSGSGSDSPVTVQVQDANNTVIGSASATIPAAANVIGVWQVTVAFTQPATAINGYILAFDAAGQQTSIPVTFVGSGGQAPVAPAVGFTPQSGALPIVTATPATGATVVNTLVFQ